MGSEVQDREFARHVARRNALGELAAQLRPQDAPVGCVRASSPEHRALDWRAPGGPLVCGLCHPPAHPDMVDRR